MMQGVARLVPGPGKMVAESCRIGGRARQNGGSKLQDWCQGKTKWWQRVAGLVPGQGKVEKRVAGLVPGQGKMVAVSCRIGNRARQNGGRRLQDWCQGKATWWP